MRTIGILLELIAVVALGSEPTSKLTMVGAAKVDITPSYPVRLSGYGSRSNESEGIAHRIWVKALAVGDDKGDGPAIWITVENCGMTPSIRDAVLKRLTEKVGLRSERLVVTVSHTHTAPCLSGWASYLFGGELPEDHQKHIDQYTDELTEKMVDVATKALAARRPAHLSWAQGKVAFAANRRVLKDGRWAGFGVQANGPVDHSLPILVAKDADGKLIAIVANYACHCTTLGGKFNQISGDWAGYAQEFIEENHRGAVALITIGCGADANPEPRGGSEQCQKHGRAVADEVARLLKGKLDAIDPQLDCRLLNIDLPLDKLPTRDHWLAQAKQVGARGYHARQFLQRMDAGEKMPKSVSYPVATWTFGNDLAMVLLGGEVVVDYAIRLKEEFDVRRLWITAYANHVPCYIPSQRILREGGYEADYSMIYYAQPARLAASVEDLIVDAVQKLVPARFYSDETQTNFPAPKSPQESLAAIKVRPGMKVELVAAEPLIVDPVAFDWGPDGRLWVVEMRDYPNGLGWNGEGDPMGKPGGRVKVLADTDGDGQYDKATVFLDKIPFPTGVKVWRKGILVTAAPDILYAEDTDGDGRADKRETLYRGFGEGNQQHRVNGLRWGLDNWLHVGNGDSGGTIKSLKTGKEVNVSGRDLRIRPDEGLIDATSGQTQFGRSRDDWGNWFGGNNSNPMWHYVLKDHYLRRNPHLAPPNVKKQVSVQPGPAPVFPVSRTLARFNDFSRANRFTSACSPMIYRDGLLGPEFSGNSFVCEPVHNLVHREIVSPTGVTFTSRRADDEQQSEFLASSDNWFRSSMVRTGPDGALWIADMYRFVIEHPKWIPKDWQRKLDLRAGDDKGRIYRVYPAAQKPRPIPRLDQLDSAGLVAALDNPNGWQRDMTQQMLIWSGDKQAVKPLEKLVVSCGRPTGRLHALCTLDGLDQLRPSVLVQALFDKHPGVRRHAVRLCEDCFDAAVPNAKSLRKQLDLDPLATNPKTVGDFVLMLYHEQVNEPVPFLHLQLAYSLGAWNDNRAASALGNLILKYHADPYLSTAVLSSVGKQNVGHVLARVLGDVTKPPPEQLVERLLGMAASFGEKKIVDQMLDVITRPGDDGFESWQLSALVGLLDALGRRKVKLDETRRSDIDPLVDHARQLVRNADAARSQRLMAVRILGQAEFAKDDDADRLEHLLSPQHAPQLQTAAATALSHIADRRTTEKLLADWPSHTPALRSQILDILLSRATWTSELLHAVETRKLTATAFDARRRQQLLTHKSDIIRRRAEKVFAGASNRNRDQIVQQYRAALTLSADASRGKAVYAKRCASCHRLEEIGHIVGPDLAALTDKSPQAMLVAILDPNRAVEDKFLDYAVITNDGGQLTGILTGETGNSIILKANEGKEHVILRSDIEELRATGKSLMPEGVEKDLTKQDVADLIAYVRQIGPPPKQFSGNKPAVVRPDEKGVLRLLATNCKIYGPRIVFEQKYRNLGWWAREDDRAVWSLVVPQSGRYRVVLDYASHNDAAGDRFRLTVADKTITGVVEGTGTWDDYRQKEIGSVELPAGAADLVFRSDGRIKSALIDLRGIWLEPVNVKR